MSRIKRSKSVLCLGNIIIATFSTLSSSNVEAKELSVKEVINQFTQKSWRFSANNDILGAKDGDWIKKEKYGDSIRKVIGKAIADCITDSAEFANKGKNDVITFEETTPSGYTPANWNAVILWNYLHEVKQFYVTQGGYIERNKIFQDVYEKTFNYYDTHYKGIDKLQKKIEDAIKDIKAYDDKLMISNEVRGFINGLNEILRVKKQTYLGNVDNIKANDLIGRTLWCTMHCTSGSSATETTFDAISFREIGPIRIKTGDNDIAIYDLLINYSSSTGFTNILTFYTNRSRRNVKVNKYPRCYDDLEPSLQNQIQNKIDELFLIE